MNSQLIAMIFRELIQVAKEERQYKRQEDLFDRRIKYSAPPPPPPSPSPEPWPYPIPSPPPEPWPSPSSVPMNEMPYPEFDENQRLLKENQRLKREKASIEEAFEILYNRTLNEPMSDDYEDEDTVDFLAKPQLSD